VVLLSGSEYVYVFIRLFISILLLEIQLSRGNTLNGLALPQFIPQIIEPKNKPRHMLMVIQVLVRHIHNHDERLKPSSPFDSWISSGNTDIKKTIKRTEQICFHSKNTLSKTLMTT
jgi:hypothetical protein